MTALPQARSFAKGSKKAAVRGSTVRGCDGSGSRVRGSKFDGAILRRSEPSGPTAAPSNPRTRTSNPNHRTLEPSNLEPAPSNPRTSNRRTSSAAIPQLAQKVEVFFIERVDGDHARPGDSGALLSLDEHGQPREARIVQDASERFSADAPLADVLMPIDTAPAWPFESLP